ncbi:MAG: magnesium chelatase, partial [Bacteroidota bacterium]
EGNTIDILNDMPNVDYERTLKSVPGLVDLINEFHRGQETAVKLFLMEFALHGLAEFSMISKNYLTAGLQFKDLLSSMFTMPKTGQIDEEDDEDNDDQAMGGGRR